MYYVYVLKDINGKLYFGSTDNLRRRIFEHQAGKSYSTKRSTWKLVYYEAYVTEKDAREREHQIKYHGQAKRWLKSRLKNSLK